MFNFPDYMGKTSGDVATFLNNFSTELPKYATILGISPAELVTVREGAAIYDWYENTYLGQLRQASKAGTDARDEFAADKIPTPFVPQIAVFTPPPVTTAPINDGFVGFIDTLVKRIRLTDAYKKDSQIGILLRISGTVAPVVTPQKGAISGVTALAGFAMEIKAVRMGAKTVLFYDMADASAPVLLGAIASATFEDERPPSVAGQSEMRAYAVRYGDVQGKPLSNSLMSDVVSVPTHP